MEITLFASGDLVDEIVLAAGSIELRRVGAAQYVARLVEGSEAAEVELWTTAKGSIDVAPRDPHDPEPKWLQLAVDATGALVSITAQDVDVHIEHLDRGAYFVGLTKRDDLWTVNLVSDGYIKTRVLSSTVAPARTPH